MSNIVEQNNMSSQAYPVSSNSVAKMLGITTKFQDMQDESSEKTEEVSFADLPVPNLPVSGSEKSIVASGKSEATLKTGHELLKPTDSIVKVEPEKKIFKAFFPYLLVFLVGLVGYYFFFSNSNLNLGFIFKPNIKQKIAPITAKDTALMELEKDSETLKNYQKWISQFYFNVSDFSVIDPDSDISGNGLTNFQKFLLDLNPKSYDTLGLGMADSEAVAQGINPLSGGKLTQKQQDIIEKYFDLEIINNRLAVEGLRKNGLVAGSRTSNQITSNSLITAQSNVLEAARSSNQRASTNVNNRIIRNTNNQSGGFDNPVNPEIDTNNLNVNTPGRLEIPALNINVPLIFTKDPKNFEKDLQMGVVHYPGTALPGQIGTTYISGHSSNYIWAKGNYNRTFSKLGDLPDNASFIITVAEKNGKDARFHYVVTHRKEFSPTNQEQFKNTGESIVALSTCWPVGSTKNRLVVFGKLTQIEK